MYAEQPRILPPSIFLSMFSPEALGLSLRSYTVTAPTSTVVVQNLAYFFPFTLYETTTYVRAWAYNGATANGNWDVGGGR